MPDMENSISPVDANNNSDCPDGTNGGLFEQRVKVDRKKFEQIINGDNKEMGSAEEFFKKIITETNTEITWPTKLKSGTKSKKDPHIRIVGSSEAIAKAKEKILDYLDSRKNRVTLKMDVSFTDHSHIIGKGGRSIQKVMDETGCHIHFPDSNRTNLIEKSNQVSIAGTALGAEQARCRIRELLPLTVYFELPLSGLKSQVFDTSSQPVQTIQQTYGISINIRITGKGNSLSGFVVGTPGFASIAIRGARAQCFAMKQGIAVLIDYLTGSTINSATIPITLVIDIASQHHSFVMGRGNINIRSIMQQTGVVITFPDSTSIENGSVSATHASLNARKSTVIIKGPSFDSVLFAWQEMLGYLPLVLIFDLKEGQELDASLITQLMEDLKVSILIKPKQKQNLNSIMVRGPERDSRNLFEVRKQILGLDESEVPTCCDKHAWVVASKLFSMFLPYCAIPGASLKSGLTSGCTPTGVTSPSMFNWPNAVDYSNIGYSNFAGLPAANGFLQAMFAQQLATLAAQQQQQSAVHFVQDSSSYHQMRQQQKSSFNMDAKTFEKPLSFTSLTTTPSINSPNSSSSDNSAHSPLELSPPSSHNMPSMFGRFPIEDRSAPLVTPSGWPTSAKNNDQLDYEGRKLLAIKALRDKPKANDPRTPTPIWSGFGFSKSFPQEILRSRLDSSRAIDKLQPVAESPEEVSDTPATALWDSNRNLHGKGTLRKQQSFDLSSTISSSLSSCSSNSSTSSLFNSSNFFDSLSNNCNSNCDSNGSSKCNGYSSRYGSASNNLDLAEVLTHLGFSKYIDNFQQHDIDFNTFLTLNDADLQELGISYFGRRKLSSAIFELKRALKNERGSLSPLNHFEAAPGAERSRRAKMST